MRFYIGLALALLLLGPTRASRAEDGRLTEAEFLAPLTEGHPAIVALTGRLASAEGERRAARVMNPEVGFDREAPDGAANQSIFWLRWQPPLDGRRGLRKHAAEVGLQAAASEFDWARRQLRGALRGIYADWARALEHRDLLSVQVVVMQRLADRARVRAEAGEESGLGARRLALAASEVRSELARTEAALVRARAGVRAVFPELRTGLEPVRPVLPGMLPKVDGSNRPDVVARRFEVQQVELQERLSGRFLEFPELVAGWTRFDGVPGEGPVFGLRWDVPLFDRRQGERAEAARNVAIAEARLELAGARATAELDAVYGVYDQLQAAATEATAVTADASGVVESATAAFRVGENSLTDLLETLRSVLSSQLAALELHYDALEAHRRLEAAAGGSQNSGGRE